MGSGSLAAMSVMETGYSDDMSVSQTRPGHMLSHSAQEEQAIDLVRRAIRAGIFNDLGSGSNVDLTVIRHVRAWCGFCILLTSYQDGDVTVLRNYETPNDVKQLRGTYARPTGRHIPSGATRVLHEMFEKCEVEETDTSAAAHVHAWFLLHKIINADNNHYPLNTLDSLKLS